MFASLQLLPFATTGVKLLQQSEKPNRDGAVCEQKIEPEPLPNDVSNWAYSRDAANKIHRVCVCVHNFVPTLRMDWGGWIAGWCRLQMVRQLQCRCQRMVLHLKRAACRQWCLPSQASLTLQTRAQNGCADGMLSRLSRHIRCIWRTAAK